VSVCPAFCLVGGKSNVRRSNGMGTSDRFADSLLPHAVTDSPDWLETATCWNFCRLSATTRDGELRKCARRLGTFMRHRPEPRNTSRSDGSSQINGASLVKRSLIGMSPFRVNCAASPRKEGRGGE